MPDTNRCPQCNAPLPADAPRGLCPECLLKLGMPSGASGASPSGSGPVSGSGTAPTTPLGGRFEPPSIEELAAKFPQLEIIELLGQGGMGAVYKARQPKLNRLVALKVLPRELGDDPSFSERFTREAQALAHLNHPHIVAVYDFGQADGLCYFLMEFVDGVNLRETLRAGQLAPADALRIVPQVCEALQFAHDEGIVHRDIKPENILIDKRGRVKIADFGLAKLLKSGGHESPGRQPSLTHTHQVMGTLHYMSPEQMQGAASIDHRADIYSLGVVLYELLTGELPVGRFVPPSKMVNVDVRLDEVVLRTLERKPELRYQQVSELKTELETIGGISVAARQRILGREYRSKASIFGLPLVHIAYGIDPQTGSKRVAKGVVAIGDVAVGLIAFGGTAVGGIAFGGLAAGLVSCGGLSIAIFLAIGGVAMGGFSFGALSLGVISLGGVAVGMYSFGGFAWGLHSLATNIEDPEAARLFLPWAGYWPLVLTGMSIVVPLSFAAQWLVVWLVFRRQAASEKTG